MRIQFEIRHRSRKSHARLGVLKTRHGIVETPAFVPVATKATIKALTIEQTLATGTQILIANTFHLHEQPGEKIIRASGGLHRFMGWPKPLMTDSGGFQIFSLGFGRDLGTATKISTAKKRHGIRAGSQPRGIRISEDGVTFLSVLDGRKIFLGPKESMRIQAALGADIIFAFDECPPPHATRAYHQEALRRTHRWAEISLAEHSHQQAIFGIVQGGKYRDLRLQSAKFIRALPFDGFGIGGEFGASKPEMMHMLNWVTEALPEQKPRHLLGIGYLEDIPAIIRAGIDTFDCIVPTHYARRGIVFTSQGELNINKASFMRDRRPLDPACACGVCTNHTRAYLCHLFRAHELTAFTLATSHNLFFFNAFVAKIRAQIRMGKL